MNECFYRQKRAVTCKEDKFYHREENCYSFSDYILSQSYPSFNNKTLSLFSYRETIQPFEKLKGELLLNKQLKFIEDEGFEPHRERNMYFKCRIIKFPLR